MRLGIAGVVTRTFIDSPLTPLLLLTAIGLGMLALFQLPREEEPQIRVPMVDIHVQANGLQATDAVELATKPLEDIINGIDGVEHVYSRTEDDRVVVTARFFVGTDEDDAILRVHETIRAHMDEIPIGIPEPLIVGLGINDVPILVLTLVPKPGVAARWDDNALYNIAEELESELVKVDDVGRAMIVGGRADQIRIEPDPEHLALYGVTLNALIEKIENANRAFLIGRVRRQGDSIEVIAGRTLQGVPDIGQLLITTRDERPVYVRDVARVVVGARPEEHRVWHLSGKPDDAPPALPAVSLALAKRTGANAVEITERVLERLALVEGRLVPDGVDVIVTRDYGETASEKANDLLTNLLGATATVVLIITIFVGWREGLVVLVVIPATILLTFFWSWLLGYTINRVSMFALIFSIGILVDDAIVVVENINRHWRMKDGRKRRDAAIDAVAEVGNPTIIANLTIIAALLPMLFVSGLMGPYMSPIPVNASAAAVFSLLLALVVTPWQLTRLHRRHTESGASETRAEPEHGGVLGRVYLRVARPLLVGRRRPALFLAGVVLATLAALALFATRTVTVKLLPFDDKSELQVLVDLPEGASLEATERVLSAAADRLTGLPELLNVQAYAGTAAPFNFNGLVRQYYLRERPEQGELQVNLLAKGARERASHTVALDVRERLADLAVPEGTSIKVVEVPPGPPVLATLLAEIYGPDAEARREVARAVRAAFEAVDYVVDVDDSFGEPPVRLRFAIDQENLEFHGVEQEAVYDTLAALLGGVSVGYSHRGHGTDPIEIAIRLPKRDLFLSERLLATPVPGMHGNVELGDVVDVAYEEASYPIFRRDGRAAEMVTGELAGAYEAPIYGMLDVEDRLEAVDEGPAAGLAVRYHGQPADESVPSLLWDGEWEITYVTFRDMGGAFAVAILGIYFLLVGQFGNFKLPLVILVPVPLTLIGIVLGHRLFDAAFTATSMIGFIALAGIIVRNAILLADFVRARRTAETPLRQTLLEAGAIRFKPIFLTAITTMAGAAFIVPDPIFQGLALSLLFGLASSTVLTVLIIPAIYVLLRDDRRPWPEPAPQPQPQGGPP